MARADKAAAVAELAEAFRESSAAVLTEYRGLTVAQLKELRTALAGNATYAVVKNTLSKIAAREAGVDGLDTLLEGPSAIAFVTGDPVEVAKGLRDFARNNQALIVKGGVLDGKPLTADEIRRLADLESREVLLAKLAGGMKASLQQAVNLFTAPLSQMARLAGALEAAATADPSILAGGTGTPEPAAEPEPAADAASAATDTDAATETAEAATETAEAVTETAEAETETAEASTDTTAEAAPETDGDADATPADATSTDDSAS